MSGVIKKEGNIFGRFKIFAIVSLVIIVLGVVALCFAGFNSGIEFTGGAEISVDFGSGVTDEQYGDIESGLKDYLASVGAEVSGTAKITDGENVSGIVVSFGSEINSQGADKTAMNALVNMLGVGGNDISADERASLEDYLGSGFNFGSIVSVSDRVTSLGVADADVSVYTVSPTINNQGLVLSAISLAVAFVAVLVYVAVRFKTVAKEPKMSDGLKVALAVGIGVVHDALVTLALMLFAGWLFNIEITTFFTAVFALIIVYSVYNAIVVFDRIRVNNDRYADLAGSAEVVDKSVKEAFKRIVLTSAAIFAAVLIVAIFASPAVRSFAIPVLFALVSGTYSSLCVTPCLWKMFNGKNDDGAERQSAE